MLSDQDILIKKKKLKFYLNKFNLPNADIIHDYCFYCPNHNDLSNKDIDRIISAMKAW